MSTVNTIPLKQLSYIHDHLINATGSQKVSRLCLLNLSAAFDTTDHSILITPLSCLGFMAQFSTGLSYVSSCLLFPCEM